MDTLDNKILIGIGHKARQGKDTIANLITKHLPNSTIVHWADALKEELSNINRLFPLIYTTNLGYYSLLNNKEDVYYYEVIKDEEVPYLDELFKKRNITEYWGMDEKDSEMLQFWGTDYRRQQNPAYWINKTFNHIKKLNERYILIPDTRFKNEYFAIKDNNTSNLYIDIKRIDNDKQFIDKERDPNHKSEIDLDGIPFDFEFIAETGNLDLLETYAKKVIERVT